MRRMFQIRWRRWSTFVATWTSSWRPPVVLRRWGRISSMIVVFILRWCSIFYSYGWPQAWRRSRHTFPVENEKMGKLNYGFLHKILKKLRFTHFTTKEMNLWYIWTFSIWKWKGKEKGIEFMRLESWRPWILSMVLKKCVLNQNQVYFYLGQVHSTAQYIRNSELDSFLV